MGINALADREALFAALADAEAGQDALADLSLDACSPTELLKIAARREVLARRQEAFDHRLLAQLVATASPSELGESSMTKVLAYALKISTSEAKRRLDHAADLGPRTSITGVPLEPIRPNTAAAAEAGKLGAEHVGIIRSFFKKLPADIPADVCDEAEKRLADLATQHGPENFRRAADHLAFLLDQDGTLDDEEKRRKRGIKIGRQNSDGLVPVSGYLDPECAATLEAVNAKLGAPGMCNPDDETPCVTGKPSAEQIQDDHRTPDQRRHDALLAAGRIALSSKKLGKLNGLPVTVIVSTTLKELESAAGAAVTAGGTRIPMRDLIRMASHAHHYLAIFDDHGQALWLGRSKRIASPAQRIVLHARDRGCTAPGCTVSAYRAQVHHATKDWSMGGETNIDDLTLACGPDNRKVTESGWRTRMKNGRCEWIPPKHLDDPDRPRVNNYHHPENIWAPERTDSDDDEDG